MSVNTGDTAWLLMSSALVMLMTPGLAFFYGGMVRRKNILSTIMMSFMIWAWWACSGCSTATAWASARIRAALSGGSTLSASITWGRTPSPVYATTVPHLAFMIFQAMFAIITVALITGSIVERMKFSALSSFRSSG